MIPVISIFGALILPVVMIWKNRRKPLQNPYLFSLGSFVFYGIALLQELLAVKRRLFVGDIAGLEDTIGAVIVICVVLLLCTMLLNWIALAICYEK